MGIFGPYGLSTDDLQHFHEEVDQGEADAMQAYCMAFRREAVNGVGLMRECFRFYRNLDIDYCFQFKDKGYRIVADSSLPLVQARTPAMDRVGRQPAGRVEPQEFRPLPAPMGSTTGPVDYGQRPGVPGRFPPLTSPGRPWVCGPASNLLKTWRVTHAVTPVHLIRRSSITEPITLAQTGVHGS